MSTEKLAPYSPILMDAVRLLEGFWKVRSDIIQSATIEQQYGELERSGAIDNFRRTASLAPGRFKGIRFIDSDVYKWLEAASYALGRADEPRLAQRMSQVIGILGKAQMSDGYLNSYIQLNEPERRWTNLGIMHEMYCAGHLFQAAAAHHRMTSCDSLLTIACRFADHLVDTFGPGKNEGYPGHQEVELGLIDLFRVVGDRRYLELAAFFINQRGRTPSPFSLEMQHITDLAGTSHMHRMYQLFFRIHDGQYDGRYAQDHLPVREQPHVVGHAVRALYMYSAMTDLAIEGVAPDLEPVLERLWRNMVEKRMYITGGLGSCHDNEGLSTDYDLPNLDAYAETCASIANVMWNHRMLRLTGQGRYADLVERALYNGVLAGISLDGLQYSYVNPLASDGSHHRRDWFECACCPPNVARLLASLEEYIYLHRGDELVISQYVASQAHWRVDNQDIQLIQQTDYPWGERVVLRIEASASVRFTLALRRPGWCADFSLAVNGVPVSADTQAGFVRIERSWQDGDTIVIHMGLPIRRTVSHPYVRENRGRVALERGPLVYCLEDADNRHPLASLLVGPDASFETRFDPCLLGGVVTIDGRAQTHDIAAWQGRLYADSDDSPRAEVPFRAIPYYAWGNRLLGDMMVWLFSESC